MFYRQDMSLRVLPAVAFALAALSVRPALGSSPEWKRTERLTFETLREGDTSGVPYETAVVVWRYSDRTTESSYVSRQGLRVEKSTVRTAPDGRFLGAEREDFDGTGRREYAYRAWLTNDEVRIERTDAGGHVRASRKRLDERTLAVEATLMHLLRAFPFGSGLEQRILMATFSRHFITMALRQVGEETVAGPTGPVACYKMESGVDLFFTEFTTTYWVSKEAPHVLVRYRGKRALFMAPTYVTVLRKAEFEPASPPAPAGIGGGERRP